MRRGWLLLALPLVLAACAPGLRCAGPEQAALRALDGQIATREADLARGYVIVPAQAAQTRVHICAWPREPVLFCTEPVQRAQSERRVAVDPVATQAELRALRLERAAAVARLADAQASCPR